MTEGQFVRSLHAGEARDLEQIPEHECYDDGYQSRDERNRYFERLVACYDFDHGYLAPVGRA